MSTKLTLSSNSSSFTTKFLRRLCTDRNVQYEAALISLDMFHAIPNITKGDNDLFEYSTDNGASWKQISLGTGSYELNSINDEIQRVMTLNGDYDKTKQSYFVTISPDLSNLTSVIEIKNEQYKVRFRPNSIGSLLGFDDAETVIGFGYNESPKKVDISKVTTILVNTDIIMGNRLNGAESSDIFSFTPNVAPGYKISERPNSFMFFPVSRHDIDSIEIRLTDQNSKLIDIRDESITIVLYIRPVK